MTRFSRSALALLVFLPFVGLSGCGEAPKKEQQTSETAAPEEPATRGRFETVAPENDESGLDAPGSEEFVR